MSKLTCQFCVKDKQGSRCLLYNKSLTLSDGMLIKLNDCCRATAGFASTVDAVPPPEPKVDPKQLMKMTIEMYTKTVNDLLNQGYPKAMADKVAKQYMLGK